MSHRKRRWRKRTHGTASQIGQAFPIDDESMQYRKANLPKLQGRDRREHEALMRRIEAQEEAIRLEQEEKEHHGLTDRVKKAIKPKPKPTTEKKMIGGLPAQVPIDEEQTPVEELRIEVKPVVEVAKDYGSDVKEWFKGTRVFLYLQRKADERVLKKEQEKKSRFSESKQGELEKE